MGMNMPGSGTADNKSSDAHEYVHPSGTSTVIGSLAVIFVPLDAFTATMVSTSIEHGQCDTNFVPLSNKPLAEPYCRSLAFWKTFRSFTIS